MSLTNLEKYSRSDYDKELETSINSSLSALSAADTVALALISANTTLISAVDTYANQIATITEDATANFTMDLTTYRNFTLTNSDTAGKTFIITNVPTASLSFLKVNLELVFSTTAAITYTGTITWAGGTAPNPTAAGTFWCELITADNGTNWYGSFTGLY